MTPEQEQELVEVMAKSVNPTPGLPHGGMPRSR